jgi:protein TonB
VSNGGFAASARHTDALCSSDFTLYLLHNTMKIKLLSFVTLAVLAGCASHPRSNTSSMAGENVEAAPNWKSRSSTLDEYKRDLALRITQANSSKVYAGRPQALLRSIIVVRYWVDANGKLMRSEIIRTNHDRANERTALTSLHNAYQFPKPPLHLLKQGRVDVTESWLFNDDGRFQLRTIAQPQMDE